MAKKKNKNLIKAVSYPQGKESVHDAARAKARRLQRSLSNYILGLIEGDLRASGNHPEQEKTKTVADVSSEAASLAVETAKKNPKAKT